MFRKMFCIFAVCCVILAAGCTKETQTQHAVVTGNDIPLQISWQGGEYAIDVEYKLTRIESEPWYYRLLIDGKETASGEVSDGSTQAKVAIPANETDKERQVIVEVNIPKGGEAAEWKKVVTAEQKSQFINVNGTFWVSTNLTVKDAKYVFADMPEQTGSYFKHMSTYAVPSEGDHYAGKAYNPAQTTIALADIPERNGDPCALASNNKLRMPTRGELLTLLYLSDIEQSTLNKVKGMFFNDKRFFLPFGGSCDAETGVIGFKNEFGGYWSSGDDGDEHGYLLSINNSNESFTWGVYPAYGTGMGTVRCVRNVAKPSYISHTPEKSETNAAFTVEVGTNPGEIPYYLVELRDLANNRGPYSGEVLVSEGNNATIEVLKNDDPVVVTYEIYIDDQPTGKKVTQGAKTNYAEYRSHTPTGKVPGDAFTLSVTCESDMDAFDVELKSGTTSVVKAAGSKSSPVVKLSVPANTGVERQLAIWVNGVDSKAKITQKKSAVVLAQIWSTGYLTVKNGAYTFAGEQEKGMFFKFKSRYGMEIDAGNNYTGTAYGPAAETKTYAEITYNDVDPCSLVADGKTWRMPTYEEWEKLLLLDFEFLAGKYRMYYDDEQRVYLTPSGQLKNTGSGVMLASSVRVWSISSGVKDPAKIATLALALSNNTSNPIKTEIAGDVGIMVRCVRDK